MPSMRRAWRPVTGRRLPARHAAISTAVMRKSWSFPARPRARRVVIGTFQQSCLFQRLCLEKRCHKTCPRCLKKALRRHDSLGTSFSDVACKFECVFAKARPYRSYNPTIGSAFSALILCAVQISSWAISSRTRPRSNNHGPYARLLLNPLRCGIQGSKRS